MLDQRLEKIDDDLFGYRCVNSLRRYSVPTPELAYFEEQMVTVGAPDSEVSERYSQTKDQFRALIRVKADLSWIYRVEWLDKSLMEEKGSDFDNLKTLVRMADLGEEADD